MIKKISCDFISQLIFLFFKFIKRWAVNIHNQPNQCLENRNQDDKDQHADIPHLDQVVDHAVRIHEQVDGVKSEKPADVDPNWWGKN